MRQQPTYPQSRKRGSAVTPKQFSMSSGEISPSVSKRADLSRFDSSLAKLENFFCLRGGGVQNRPGTQFIANVADVSKRSRLIPFAWSRDQTYIIEFAEGLVRVYSKGGRVTTGAAPWTDLRVYLVDEYVLGSSGRTFVSTALSGDETYGATIRTWTSLTSNPPIDNALYGPGEIVYGSDGGTYRCLLTNGVNALGISDPPVPGDDLIKDPVVQPANSAYWELVVLQVAHDPEDPASAAWWALVNGSVEIATDYTEQQVQELNYTQSGDVLTLVHHDRPPRELRRLGAAYWELKDIQFVSAVSPPTGVAISQGKVIPTTKWQEWKEFEVVVTAYDPATGEQSSGSVPLSNASTPFFLTQGIKPDPDQPMLISWTAVPGAELYSVYRGANKVHGWLGDAKEPQFFDFGNVPRYDEQPPSALNPFGSTGNYPSCVTYHEQRLVFSNTLNDPQRVWMSQSSNYKNFGGSDTALDGDAVIFTPAVQQVDGIVAMASLGVMFLLTSAGEFAARGGGDGAMTPSNVDVRAQSYYGSSRVQPLIIGNEVLFIVSKSLALRSLFVEPISGRYESNDLSVMADHLLIGRTITQMAYAQSPHSIIWTIRDDGTLLGLTYLREHEVWGWHRQVTDGEFESVASVSEGDIDAVYVTVKRTNADGTTTRNIERFAPRDYEDPADGMFLDAALTYNGSHTELGVLTSEAPLEAGDPAQFLTSFLGLALSDVGRQIRILGTLFTITDVVGSGGGLYYTVDLRAEASFGITTFYITYEWDLSASTFSGLDHLEGLTVGVVADAEYVGTRVVTGAAISIKEPGFVVHIGLPYVSELRTLEPELGVDSITGATKNIARVFLDVASTRGLFFGTDPDHMDEWQQRTVAHGYDRIALETGVAEIRSAANWRLTGSVIVQQRDPVACTILAITPEITVGG